MYDTQEKIDGAIVHHGKTHNRLYLMHTEQDNCDSLIPLMKDLAHKKTMPKSWVRFLKKQKKYSNLTGIR